MSLAEDIRYLVEEIKREQAVPSRAAELMGAYARLALLMEKSLPILEKLERTGSK